MTPEDAEACESAISAMPHYDITDGDLRELWQAAFRYARQQPSPEVQELKALLLLALYHHQGGSSEIGQPIRRALGMGQHDHLTDEQIAEARRALTKFKEQK